MTAKKTFTTDTPGGMLTYDVREAVEPSGAAPLMAIGLPMGAHGFDSLADQLTDRTVITYDPRGVERSTREPGSGTGAEDHVGDVVRVLEAAADGEPVDLVGSSGGAVIALELVATRGDLVRSVVAHEPPLPRYLPDGDVVEAAMRKIAETYQAQGQGHAMAQFIALIMESGPFTPEYLDRPAPDPAMFGLAPQDDGSRDDVMFGSSMVWMPGHELDRDALLQADRLIIGVGEETGEAITARASRAVAELLGREPVVFPGGHSGFGGGEYGQPAGDPAGFAAVLRRILAE